MRTESPILLLHRLRGVLESCAPACVAVSGGVDSVTLAFVAHRTLRQSVRMFHAVSPAVPPSATLRVRRYADQEGWQLHVINAGEFDDRRYISNPANRCYYCKSNLYATISECTNDQILSGTNLDDLGDWRPGLKAAQRHAARHPYVEASIDKQGVRKIARHFDLDDIAELPAAPCLSSRVETGIPIDATDLHFIDSAERFVRDTLSPRTVRCRIREKGIVVELDQQTLSNLPAQQKQTLARELAQLSSARDGNGRIDFAVYEQGSAFLRDQQ